METHVHLTRNDSLDLRKHCLYSKVTCLSYPFPSFSVQVCSTRDAVQKEGAVISFMCSIILQMLLLMQIMIVGIHGDGDSVIQSHDQGQDLTVPAEKDHIG